MWKLKTLDCEDRKDPSILKAKIFLAEGDKGYQDEVWEPDLQFVTGQNIDALII